MSNPLNILDNIYSFLNKNYTRIPADKLSEISESLSNLYNSFKDIELLEFKPVVKESKIPTEAERFMKNVKMLIDTIKLHPNSYWKSKIFNKNKPSDNVFIIARYNKFFNLHTAFYIFDEYYDKFECKEMHDVDKDKVIVSKDIMSVILGM